MEARIGQIEGALAEQEDFLTSLGNEDRFSDDFAELQCAMHYLEVCGIGWQEMGKMTVEEILERYHQFLQEDVV